MTFRTVDQQQARIAENVSHVNISVRTITYHDKPANAQENEIAPISKVARKQEANTRYGEHGYNANNGTPCCKIVDWDQWMCSFANPPNRGVCACCSEYTKHSNAYCHGSLLWCNGIIIGSKPIWWR
jgi:hypothetical protein